MRRLRENNYILCMILLLCCVGVIFGVYFISNQAGLKDAQTGVIAVDAERAYDFLNQTTAVEEHLKVKKEYLTYREYKDFLDALHLNGVVSFDWETAGNKVVTRDDFYAIRDQIENLFSQSQGELSEGTFLAGTQVVSETPEYTDDTLVRVLLLQNGKELSRQLYLTADRAYRIKTDDKVRKKKKNTVLSVRKLKLRVGETAVLTCPSGSLYVADAKGVHTSLAYHGSFEVRRYKGGYALINCVPIEQYLCGVVQSEMPTYFEPEALRAQALCARTYIISQLMGDGIEAYDADVDDSVHYQVYNQIAMDDKVKDAVASTKGKIMTSEGEPIQAFFFSTSYGQTANNAIWNQTILPYLSGVRVNAKKKTPKDLSDEDAFLDFIKGRRTSDYDSDSPYYRWTAELDFSGREEQLFAAIESMLSIGDDRVKLIPEKTKEKTYYLYEYGNFKSLKVKKRAKSGAILKILLTFEHGKVTVTNENSIRKILGIGINGLYDRQGETLPLSGMAPSVYAAVRKTKNGITLLGGGLGHGIGMSQYGANAMAEQGLSMEQIVNRFYRDVEITQLYE